MSIEHNCCLLDSLYRDDGNGIHSSENHMATLHLSVCVSPFEKSAIVFAGKQQKFQSLFGNFNENCEFDLIYVCGLGHFNESLKVNDPHETMHYSIYFGTVRMFV